MDVHNTFDEYLDLRDQQDEGPQAEAATTTTQDMTHSDDNQALTTTTTTTTSDEPMSNAIVPESHASTLTTATHGDNHPTSNQDEAAAAAEAVASATAAAAVAAMTQSQSFYLPDWSAMLSATGMNTASLTTFLDPQHLSQQQQQDSSNDPVTTTSNAAAAATSTDESSTFIPPHMLMNPPTANQGQLVENQDTAAATVPENKTDEEEEKNVDNGRMKTRSSTRRASSAANTGKRKPADEDTASKKKMRGRKLYCICQKPYTGDPMVQCDKCSNWFHCACVDLDPDEADDIDTWMCNECTQKYGGDEKTEKGEDVPTTKKEPTPEAVPESPPVTKKAYGTRQAKSRTCLLPSCKNVTREDSYCSDKCAAQDALRKAGDSEYVPTRRSLSPSPERRTKPAPEKKKVQQQQQQQQQSPPKEQTPPEDDPIRKNVVKNMTTILKSIITFALEKNPNLFEKEADATATVENDNNVAMATPSANEDSNADQAEKRAATIAQEVEDQMFEQLAEPGKNNERHCGGQYKNKFRSLLHNLKDKSNQAFQMRVITGELSPKDLVAMSAKDMANPELKSMSESMIQESIKNSVLKVSNMPFIKKTHKGDIIMVDNTKRDDRDEDESLRVSTYRSRQDSASALADGTESRRSSMSTNTTGAATTPTSYVPETPTSRQHHFDHFFPEVMEEDDDENNSGEAASAKKRRIEELLEEENYVPESFSDNEEDRDEGEKQKEERTTATMSSNNKSEQQLPSIWQGRVNMPQVAEFNASARQIGGRTLSTDEWSEVLSPTMWIEGRIPEDRVVNYVTQTQYSTSREIVLLEIEAASTEGDQQLDTLLRYFDSRKRYGVVGHNKTKIKDFYLVPLFKVQQLPDFLYVVRIEETKRVADMFLGVLVLQKQRDPVPRQPVPAAAVPQALPPSLSSFQQPPFHQATMPYQPEAPALGTRLPQAPPPFRSPSSTMPPPSHYRPPPYNNNTTPPPPHSSSSPPNRVPPYHSHQQQPHYRPQRRSPPPSRMPSYNRPHYHRQGQQASPQQQQQQQPHYHAAQRHPFY
ncbi:hypothetical protein O0I10_000875 [Lichtheimia ornata]|uniref:Transcription factor BYE1 n=1 Tax=Lichtheimia ornata TaxID=688661 RepID=A0AAD8DI17_9FUNG|nr:uncharacterized protein O0I10_000875 [Lichtheimia ornata]KAJ8663629.1 hypothetical protein O0I10_000875 [Lichtheimia ornata]